MEPVKQLYDKFVSNVIRLVKSDESLQIIATNYIFKELDNATIIKLVNSQKSPFPLFNKAALLNAEVLLQTVKILTLMEASDTWDEFKSLNTNRKNNTTEEKKENKEVAGFEKILKGIMKVPKPKEEQLKKKE